MNRFDEVINSYHYGTKAISQHYRKTMTNIEELKNAELKSAHVKADVGNKEVSAEVKDKHEHKPGVDHAAHKPT